MSNKRHIFLNSHKNRKKSWLRRSLSSLLLLLIIISGYAYYALTGSLPVIEGQLSVVGIEQKVSVSRDNHGVPLIAASNRADLAFALGFVHAQDRFFQMDLLRRRSSGRLSQLFGKVALNYDKSIIPHQFMLHAEQAYNALRSEDRNLIDAYTRGVNSGLKALRESPFEYLLLRKTPAEWRPRDTLLVVYSMYLTLQSANGQQEYLRSKIIAHSPPDIAQFLLPSSTIWDAPLLPDMNESSATEKKSDNKTIPDNTLFLDDEKTLDNEKTRSQNNAVAITNQSNEVKKIVSNNPFLVDAIQYSLFNNIALDSPSDSNISGAENGAENYVIGSNNFAVGASRTARNRAIIAGDMHLGLRVPNIWYRAQMSYPVAGGESVTLTGLTLPGTPLLIAGTNGHIGWSFTNSMIDTSDLILLKTNKQKTSYLTINGWQPFEKHSHSIIVNDENVNFDYLTTQWGPVIRHRNEWFAYRWIAYDTAAVNLNLSKLETVRSAADALKIAPSVGIPSQNFVVADSEGHIGWTIIGPIPVRQGFDGSQYSDWSDGSRKWKEPLASDKYPNIVDPEDGQLWTANGRTLSGDALKLLGDGGYALGARGQQIRDDLLALDAITEKNMLSVQLDDKAVFLSRWRTLLLKHWPQNPEYKSFRNAVENWSGRASIEDQGYTLVKRFRRQLAKNLLTPIYNAAAGFGSAPDNTKPAPYYQFGAQYESPLWSLIKQQPASWLPNGVNGWDAFIESNADQILDEALRSIDKGKSIAWGEVNKAKINHPMSASIPYLSRWLDMPHQPLAGDRDMPRAQGPAFGASERMVISPGNEQDAIFEMPGGQSGHPLSPWYNTDHNNWVEGNASPLLPQHLEYRLELLPTDKMASQY